MAGCNHGKIFKFVKDTREDLFLGKGIEARGRFVEKQDVFTRNTEHPSCEGESLALST